MATPLSDLQKKILKAWILLSTSDATVASGADLTDAQIEALATKLHAPKPAHSTDRDAQLLNTAVCNLIKAALDGTPAAGEALSSKDILLKAQNIFRNYATTLWTGEPPHPGQKELDATF